MPNHPVTRMVHMMSAAHRTKESVRTGRMSMNDLASRTIFAPRHFPKFMGCVMTVSAIAGYFYMGSIHNRKLKRQDEIHRIALEQSLQPVGRSQAAVRRMMTMSSRSSTRRQTNAAVNAKGHFAEQSRVPRRFTIQPDAPQKLMKRFTVQTNEWMNMGALDRHS